MEQAYRDCVAYGWSRMPIIEIMIPSTLDDSLCGKSILPACKPTIR
jgi:hypothetical protein